MESEKPYRRQHLSKFSLSERYTRFRYDLKYQPHHIRKTLGISATASGGVVMAVYLALGSPDTQPTNESITVPIPASLSIGCERFKDQTGSHLKVFVRGSSFIKDQLYSRGELIIHNLKAGDSAKHPEVISIDSSRTSESLGSFIDSYKGTDKGTVRQERWVKGANYSIGVAQTGLSIIDGPFALGVITLNDKDCPLQ